MKYALVLHGDVIGRFPTWKGAQGERRRIAIRLRGTFASKIALYDKIKIRPI